MTAAAGVPAALGNQSTSPISCGSGKHHKLYPTSQMPSKDVNPSFSTINSTELQQEEQQKAHFWLSSQVPEKYGE